MASGSTVTTTDYTIDYAGGLQRPHLERVDGTSDYIDGIIAPDKS